MNRKKLEKNKEKGSAMMLTVLFLLSFSLIVVYGIATPVLKETQAIKNAEVSRQSFYASESGVEDAVLRVSQGMSYGSTETLNVGGALTTTDIDTSNPSDISIEAVGNESELIRKSVASLSAGDGIAFNYGIQSGDGGIQLDNASSVLGNVNSSGPIMGSGSNLIKGTVISGGPDGYVSEIHATSSVYANTIEDSEIDADAYYQTISGATVHGSSYSGSPDQATSSMPISDEQIEAWKQTALTGGIINDPCPYKIEDDEIIGPVKIDCDLEISGNTDVTLTGHIWVDGDVMIKNSANIFVSSSLTGNSVAVIADNDSDRTYGGVIGLENTSEFFGAGNGSYVLFVSTNNHASTEGDDEAIEVQNSADGDLLVYAPYGKVLLQNSINIKEVTAYKIHLKNSAEVVYETGLINLLFDSGPSGGYTINSWNETE